MLWCFLKEAIHMCAQLTHMQVFLEQAILYSLEEYFMKLVNIMTQNDSLRKSIAAIYIY